MAGDWIKMRTDLGTSPKVVRLSSALKADRYRIIGGLHSAWCLFDAHSEDGLLVGYTTSILDDLIGWPGFSQAMADVGWLDVSDESLALPRFEAHNGQSAKRRAMDADRKRVRRMSASEADARPEKVSLREEKRREEIEAKATVHSAAPTAPGDGVEDEGRAPGQLPDDIQAPVAERDQSPPAGATAEIGAEAVPARIRGEKKPGTAARFPEFWAAYPVKKGRADALKKWKSKGCDEMADAIIAHVRRMEAEDDTWKRGFIPHGSTYINGERWTDVPTKDKPAGGKPEPSGAMPAAAEVLARGESRLENAIGFIRQCHNRGDYGEGEAALVEMQRRIAEATAKHRGQADGT